MFKRLSSLPGKWTIEGQSGKHRNHKEALQPRGKRKRGMVAGIGMRKFAAGLFSFPLKAIQEWLTALLSVFSVSQLLYHSGKCIFLSKCCCIKLGFCSVSAS